MTTTSPVQVIDKNAGKKIQWEQTGERLSFDDEALSVKCSKYQQDEKVTLDIMRNRSGALIIRAESGSRSGALNIGAESGIRYVAQITVPAAEYDTTTEGEGEEATTIRTKKELDMSQVVLTLWAI